MPESFRGRRKSAAQRHVVAKSGVVELEDRDDGPGGECVGAGHDGDAEAGRC